MKLRRNFLWAIAAHVLNAGLWAVILPISSRYLGVEDTALWLNFVVLAGLGQLLEFGFNPTLARSYSYVFAGAQSLKAIGIEEAVGPVNQGLLAELIYASRRIYILIGILAAIILWVGGGFYLIAVTPLGVSLHHVVISWLIYSLGNIVSLWFGYTNSFIIGRDDLIFYNKVLVFTRGLQLIGSVGGLMMGGGLLCLAVAALISAIVGRVLSYHRVRGYIQKAHELAPSALAINALIRVLWHNSGRYGLVMIGAFLITRANLLIAGITIGVVPAAGYNFAVQVFTFLQSLATLPFNMSLPKLNALWVKGQNDQARNLFGTALAAGLCIFMISAAAFVIAGPAILLAIKGNLIIPGMGFLIFMAIVFLLELNHGICANLLTIANSVPFVRASLLTGFAIVLGSWFAAPQFGVVGLMLVMAGWQLLYNNWRWPLLASRLLGMGYWRVVLMGFKNIK